MEQFSAIDFYRIASLLTTLSHALGFANKRAEKMHGYMVDIPDNIPLDKVPPSPGYPEFYLHSPPEKNEISVMIDYFLTPIETECRNIAFCDSAEAVSEFKSDLLLASNTANLAVTFDEVKIRIDEIDRAIRREMKLHLFMYIPADRAEYYKSWGEGKRKTRGKELPLFGNAVNGKFPSTEYDITETGNCFAVARYTACVFHLMRVLERGLCVLAKAFNVNSDHTNWYQIIDDIENKITNMGKMQNKPADWKNDEEFYSQAISYLMIVRAAWRNYTMHVRAKYVEEEAELMIKNVRAFMQKLSERLSEENEYQGRS